MIENNKKINIAIIGCGYVSSIHFDSILNISEFNLVGVCDINENKAKIASKMLNVPYFLDYKEIPLNKIDIVSICTPNYLHYSIARYFLEQGKNVIIEKPITLNIKEADDLINFSKEKKLNLFCIKQVRFNQPIRAAKAAITENNLGRMLSCNLTIHWNRPQEYFDRDEWHGKLNKDGGTLINQGAHYIDAIQWLMGPVKSVFGVCAKLNH